MLRRDTVSYAPHFAQRFRRAKQCFAVQRARVRLPVVQDCLDSIASDGKEASMLIGQVIIDDNHDEFEDGWEEEFGESEKWGIRNHLLGERGEQAAARYLEHVGYEILERNWVCPAGEADIIARQGHTVVFIEVKTRSGIEKGFPEDAVDARKRLRYEKIAGYYLSDYEEVDIPYRFDVIGILVIGKDRATIRHHVNAYGFGC